MEPQEYINQNVAAGKDIVFAEHHGSIVSTLGMMEEAVRANPGGIQGVSLELSVQAQPYIDQVAAGDLSREDFTKLVRIATVNDYLDETGALHASGRIDDETYEAYTTKLNGMIEGVLHGPNEHYTQEMLESDTANFGAVHSLIVTAAANDTPVFATDLDREVLVLADMGEMYVDDLVNRMNDTTDAELLSTQVDLGLNQSILVHRGMAHAWDVTMDADPTVTNAGTGLDDYLEAQGRDVLVITNVRDEATLAAEVKLFDSNGVSLADPSDATILNGTLYEQPDLEGASSGFTLPRP